MQKTVGMLLRQSKPFETISHAQERYETRGEVVFKMNILYHNFLKEGISLSFISHMKVSFIKFAMQVGLL